MIFENLFQEKNILEFLFFFFFPEIHINRQLLTHYVEIKSA